MPYRCRTRSPRRGAKHAGTEGQCADSSVVDDACRFCGESASCEWGRDFEYCSFWCYRHATCGRDAVDWGAEEVFQWLRNEAHLPHGRAQHLCSKAALHSGKSLLLAVTEGALRSIGESKAHARSVAARIQELRQGAWFQPEAPLAELPLTTIVESGAHAGSTWQPILQDVSHRSFAAYCPAAIDEATGWAWFNALKQNLPWQDLTDSKYQKEGKAIPRRTIFVVSPGCRCTYRYSGVQVEPFPEPDFVAAIRERCAGIAGLQDQPNACNVNLYRDGHDSVGWHTDNEELFEAEYNDATILSLTLGAGRRFCIKRSSGNWRKTEASSTVTLGHGDLCTMEGRMQRYYLHAVPKEPHVSGPRINLTWRWITKHSKSDGCPVCGPGN